MRILAVDDKAIPRRVLVRAIEEAASEAEVVACASATEVLALPDAASFDVAFVDIDMPGMSGVELARELKHLNPRVNIVFATGFGEYMADAFALHSSGYLMKPITPDAVATELENLRFPPSTEATDGRLVVRCFGDFEVFFEGTPLHFGRIKSKELLAFLVDREGAMVRLREAEAVLWGDGSSSSPLSGSYLRTIAWDLRHTLESCGHEDALVRTRGALAVDPAHLECDYFDYLAGDPLALNRWRGEYMSQYSWAETTKATLLARSQAVPRAD